MVLLLHSNFVSVLHSMMVADLICRSGKNQRTKYRMGLRMNEQLTRTRMFKSAFLPFAILLFLFSPALPFPCASWPLGLPAGWPHPHTNALTVWFGEMIHRSRHVKLLTTRCLGAGPLYRCAVLYTLLQQTTLKKSSTPIDRANVLAGACNPHLNWATPTKHPFFHQIGMFGKQDMDLYICRTGNSLNFVEGMRK